MRSPRQSPSRPRQASLPPRRSPQPSKAVRRAKEGIETVRVAVTTAQPCAVTQLAHAWSTTVFKCPEGDAYAALKKGFEGAWLGRVWTRTHEPNEWNLTWRYPFSDATRYTCCSKRLQRVNHYGKTSGICNKESSRVTCVAWRRCTDRARLGFTRLPSYSLSTTASLQA